MEKKRKTHVNQCPSLETRIIIAYIGVNGFNWFTFNVYPLKALSCNGWAFFLSLCSPFTQLAIAPTAQLKVKRQLLDSSMTSMHSGNEVWSTRSITQSWIKRRLPDLYLAIVRVRLAESYYSLLFSSGGALSSRLILMLQFIVLTNHSHISYMHDSA